MAVVTKNSKIIAGCDGINKTKKHSYKLHLTLSVFYVVDILEF